MMNGYGGMGGAGWVLMSVFWVVAIVAIIWAVMALLGRNDRPVVGAAISERPEDILDRRLASGEIDTATYEGLQTKLRATHVQRV